MSVNYEEKSFMKLTLGQNFIKLFWSSLCCYQYIAVSFDSCYAAMSVNYDKKHFMKLKPVRNFIKLFCVVYAASSILL